MPIQEPFGLLEGPSPKGPVTLHFIDLSLHVPIREAVLAAGRLRASDQRDVDGSKGLRKAIDEVFGSCAEVQRCQWHKRENVVSYLPKAHQSECPELLRDTAGLQGADLRGRKRAA